MNRIVEFSLTAERQFGPAVDATHVKYESGSVESFAAAFTDVRDACAGLLQD